MSCGSTYIWTDQGWCYLATVVDACSRRLLGWSITDHLRAELCLDALLAAVAARGGRRNLPDGIIFHTDRGMRNMWIGAAADCGWADAGGPGS
jgi:transposase InsO family protein